MIEHSDCFHCEHNKGEDWKGEIGEANTSRSIQPFQEDHTAETRKEDEYERHVSPDGIPLEALDVFVNNLREVAVPPKVSTDMGAMAEVHAGMVEVRDILCVGCPVDEVVCREGI